MKTLIVDYDKVLESNISIQNKIYLSEVRTGEKFSYSCFTEHEIELKGNIKWVIKFKTWYFVILLFIFSPP